MLLFENVVLVVDVVPLVVNPCGTGVRVYPGVGTVIGTTTGMDMGIEMGIDTGICIPVGIGIPTVTYAGI